MKRRGNLRNIVLQLKIQKQQEEKKRAEMRKQKEMEALREEIDQYNEEHGTKIKLADATDKKA